MYFYIGVFVCVFIYICLSVCVSVVFVYKCVCVCVYIPMFVCLCECTSVCNWYFCQSPIIIKIRISHLMTLPNELIYLSSHVLTH